MSRLGLRLAVPILFLPALVAAEGTDEHAHCKAHMAAAQKSAAVRSTAAYTLPDVSLLDQDGQSVALKGLLEGPTPTLVNFIYTSCTTICPVLTATFAHLDSAAPQDVARVRRVSISIDPEVDRPPRLKAYAEQQKAGPNWTFLTGTPEQIVAILQAFGAYTGSKMSHRPVTFLRAGGQGPWTRFDGFLRGAELASEVHGLVAPK